ncbi:probable inactive receptor kinase At5g16590 [Durio zibethinus]|uniref:Probable inactive receptor kinase At5g16590 n=1 Tax=Durio zibethinus TaxID=66656 RepID=A0A6P6AXM8_DURZI|nr:probable inactive receptor kinase At5g16590 [Durio zibethinus]
MIKSQHSWFLLGVMDNNVGRCELRSSFRQGSSGGSLSSCWWTLAFMESVKQPLSKLSLRFNALSGSIPSDFAKLTSLRNLYLEGNGIFAEIPGFLFSLQNIVKLNLVNNNFRGMIRENINNLTRLGTFYLENNQLSGSSHSVLFKEIPENKAAGAGLFQGNSQLKYLGRLFVLMPEIFVHMSKQIEKLRRNNLSKLVAPLVSRVKH